MGQQEAAPVPFLKPDPTAHLVGCSNEAPVIMNGQRMTALIDSGAQISSISSWFCEDLTLQTHALGRLLELEGTGGSVILYLRYVEGNLQIMGIKNYNKDILLLVIPTMTYSEKIPVMVGSKIIDWSMSDHNLETGSFGGCHVWVTTATPHWPKWNQGAKGAGPFLPKG